ncbi:AAA family ATPase [Trinickia diaoshuihuensis]|uniref:AAA family ATPase n=1 Tax=Trinickia diaoshuihuensis TaxID=2292265 RepID=UPI000E244571|nr:ATP-binding protein [Trinickia diaoshuihuensis]
MLLRFSAKNHASIKDLQEISWIASTQLKEELSHTSDNVLTRNPSLEVLPVLVLYGANAAGKTNILDALVAFSAGIEGLAGDLTKTIGFRPFALDDESHLEPSIYEADVAVNGTRYTYGYAHNATGIVQEWLYSFPKGARNTLFERDFTGDEPHVYFGPSFKPIDRTLRSIAERSNTLLLAHAESINHSMMLPVWLALSYKVLAVRLSNGPMPETALAQQLKDHHCRDEIVQFLSNIDAGITDYSVTKEESSESRKEVFRRLAEFMKTNFNTVVPPDANPDEEYRLTFTHLGVDGKKYEIPYSDESMGTRYLASLLGPMMIALAVGGVLVVDEIATNLHTKLSEKIIKLFTSSTSNPMRAQLIFSTHDTNLLSRDLLRRDEVWFAEKNDAGETSVYPLTDFSARAKENIEKGYLEGRYGAIPFFGRDLSLIKECRES